MARSPANPVADSVVYKTSDGGHAWQLLLNETSIGVRLRWIPRTTAGAQPLVVTENGIAANTVTVAVN